MDLNCDLHLNPGPESLFPRWPADISAVFIHSSFSWFAALLVQKSYSPCLLVLSCKSPQDGAVCVTCLFLPFVILFCVFCFFLHSSQRLWLRLAIERLSLRRFDEYSQNVQWAQVTLQHLQNWSHVHQWTTDKTRYESNWFPACWKIIFCRRLILRNVIGTKDHLAYRVITIWKIYLLMSFVFYILMS